MLAHLVARGERVLPGEQAFALYATYGLPLEITRDIAREQELDVDENGFRQAMDVHRLASGAGEAFGPLGGEDVDIYRELLAELEEQGKLGPQGVAYNPYEWLEVEGPLLGLVRDGKPVFQAHLGERVEVLIPETGFYVESGGQVSDTGTIISAGAPAWELRVVDMRKPAAGIIVHVAEVVHGEPKIGDLAIARVDGQRRQDIMRNHTATHLLHAALREILGEHARQAGSLVAPDRLRFDFTHPEALTQDELERIEAGVNRNILGGYELNIKVKSLQQAISEGAMALFGEKYGETVRTITIGETEPFSYELCGGTHVEQTGDIGLFLITSEGSAAAGIRRIEAVTGRGAYELVFRRFQALKQASDLLSSPQEEVPGKIQDLIADLGDARKQIAALRKMQAENALIRHLDLAADVRGVPVLAATLQEVDIDTLRSMTDRFRQRYPSGVAVLASITPDGRPILVASVSEDLVKRGLHAGELVKFVAAPLGGSGGGRPTMAQAGGKEGGNLEQALASVMGWVAENLR
jgi:alanyl-tRNA synthetase